MKNMLTIVLFGKKQAGKSSICNFIRAKYLNTFMGDRKLSWRFRIDECGNLVTMDGEKFSGGTFEGCKLYSFADLLKRFCIDILGVPESGCYGDEKNKNVLIEHLRWENFPIKTGKQGSMSSREVLQFFGTDIIRRWYGDAWARGTYNQIFRDKVRLSVIDDGRFLNEMLIGKEMGLNVKLVKLTRSIDKDNHPSETALDNLPDDKYDLVIKNDNMSSDEKCNFINPYIDVWFADSNLHSQKY